MEMQNLERITRDKCSLLESKNIYFAGFSRANTDYFLECFPEYSENIKGIFAILDMDERTPMTADVGGKAYSIKPLNDVKTLDTSTDVLIIMYEYEREAHEKILGIHGIEDVHSMNSIQDYDQLPVYWFADRATEAELSQREKYADYGTENLILFKSGARQYVYGEDFSDNSRALFEYMLKSGYNRRWKLVWLVYDTSCKDYDIWKKHENVEFIGVMDSVSEDKEKRNTYYRYLCIAKFAFVTDDETFFRRRRADQTLVQLWHGDGVKARTRFRVMEKRWDYMTSTSRFYAESDREVFGLRADQTLACGLPKDDWIFFESDLTESFRKSIEGYGHYILWAPTFRRSVKGLELLNENVSINETGLPILGTRESCDKLNEKLKLLNCLLIIKLHPVTDLSLHEGRTYSNIRLMTNQDLYAMGLHINHIMSLFDAFISDYSSAVTSYMGLDRPMAFTLDDLDEYEGSRGFVFDPIKDYLPGVELYTDEDMEEFIEDVCCGRDTSAEKRRRLIKTMLDYSDGKNSERLLEMLSIKK